MKTDIIHNKSHFPVIQKLFSSADDSEQKQKSYEQEERLRCIGVKSEVSSW